MSAFLTVPRGGYAELQVPLGSPGSLWMQLGHMSPLPAIHVLSYSQGGGERGVGSGPALLDMARGADHKAEICYKEGVSFPTDAASGPQQLVTNKLFWELLFIPLHLLLAARSPRWSPGLTCGRSGKWPC